jgi:hypothetical protein
MTEQTTTTPELTPEVRALVRKLAYVKTLQALPPRKREMVAAMPDSLLRDIVNDNRGAIRSHGRWPRPRPRELVGRTRSGLGHRQASRSATN